MRGFQLSKVKFAQQLRRRVHLHRRRASTPYPIRTARIHPGRCRVEKGASVLSIRGVSSNVQPSALLYKRLSAPPGQVLLLPRPSPSLHHRRSPSWRPFFPACECLAWFPPIALRQCVYVHPDPLSRSLFHRLPCLVSRLIVSPKNLTSRHLPRLPDPSTFSTISPLPKLAS